MKDRNKIKKIVAYNNHGDTVYEVGKNGVDSIKDDSMEYEDHIHVQYCVYGKGDFNEIAVIIGGNLIVEFDKEQQK